MNGKRLPKGGEVCYSSAPVERRGSRGKKDSGTQEVSTEFEGRELNKIR